MEGNYRRYITAEAFLAILDSKLVPKARKGVRESLIKALIDDVATGATIKKQMSTPVRNRFVSPVTVFSTPERFASNEKQKARKGRNARKNILKSKGSPKHHKSIRKKLTDFCFENFNGSTKEFMNSFARLVKPNLKKENHSPVKYFNGSFHPKDITYMLQKAKGKKSSKGEPQSLMEQVIRENAKEVFSISVAECIFMEQNLSGTRLFEHLRKKMSGVLPSRRMEITVKKDMEETFFNVLLPRRTASGWQVDPTR